MDLLFKREQYGGLSRVDFKLWGKIELNEEEQSLVARYDFDKAILIEVPQPNLLRRSFFAGFGVFIVASGLFWMQLQSMMGVLLAAAVAVGAAFWYYDAYRETIYVRDLMHGRHFSCDSVIELARKEAWLATIVSYLRQVMESAKHWDGTETHRVEPLPKEEARQVMIRGV